MYFKVFINKSGVESSTDGRRRFLQSFRYIKSTNSASTSAARASGGTSI